MGLTLLMSSLAEVGTPSEEKMAAGELTGVPCFPPSSAPPPPVLVSKPDWPTWSRDPGAGRVIWGHVADLCGPALPSWSLN